MSHVSMILSALLLMAMVVVIAPNIFALNRGHVLRNIAIWLAIFLALGLFYQAFGPGSPHPLFQGPAGLRGVPAENATPPGDNAATGDQSNSKDFNPPSE